MGQNTRRARGELEDQVMRILWSHDQSLSVREILAHFSENLPAFSTLATALTRLHSKGLVIRAQTSPRKSRYKAAVSADEHVGTQMLSMLKEAENRQAALMQFAGNLDPDEIEVLQQSMRVSPRQKK